MRKMLRPRDENVNVVSAMRPEGGMEALDKRRVASRLSTSVMHVSTTRFPEALVGRSGKRKGAKVKDERWGGGV